MLEHATDAANHWCSTENNQTNAWYVSMSNGNVNNNNKYNSMTVRAVAALGRDYIDGWTDAFFNCCRHKYTSEDCSEYRLVSESDYLRLALEVQSRTYTPGPSRLFAATRPCYREIYAAMFQDRIAHHWLCMRLEPMFERRFVEQGNVSFNCRPGFGTLRAHRTLQVRMSSHPHGWVLKFDFQGFFMSIDKERLLSMLRVFVGANYRRFWSGHLYERDYDTVMWLMEVIIRNNPSKDCVRMAPPCILARIAPHKRLNPSDDRHGLPIGNLPSQLLANCYLSYFDEFVLGQCHARKQEYIRFVDDGVLVGDDKAALLETYSKAVLYAQESGLTIHPDKFYIQPVRHGVKFVGAVIYPDRTYVSNRIVGGFERVLRGAAEGRMTPERLARIVCSSNSYTGFLIHHRSFNLRRRLMRKYGRIFRYVTTDAGFCKMRTKRKYRLNKLIIKDE